MSLRAVRLAVAVAIAVLFSGVPQVVSAASADCCDERCEGSLAGKECPPSCGFGACAKVRPAIDAGARPAIDLPVSPGVTYAREVRRPVLPVVTSGVFHPPRS
jgi:hypothetical protein